MTRVKRPIDKGYSAKRWRFRCVVQESSEWNKKWWPKRLSLDGEHFSLLYLNGALKPDERGDWSRI